jgi:DNA-directed RNA polymerase subunit beta
MGSSEKAYIKFIYFFLSPQPPMHASVIPNLLEVQRASFFRFLQTGLVEERQRRSLIQTRDDRQLILYPECYRLEPPVQTYQEALRLGTTYTARRLLPVACRLQGVTRFEWVPIGTLPLLTRQGHFLINGTPRVLVAQRVRGPGLYCGVRFLESRLSLGNQGSNHPVPIYYADLVPERGAWARIEWDEQHRVWLRRRRCGQLPRLLILQAVGIPFGVLLDRLGLENIRPSRLPLPLTEEEASLNTVTRSSKSEDTLSDARTLLSAIPIHPTTRIAALNVLSRLIQFQERLVRVDPTNKTARNSASYSWTSPEGLRIQPYPSIAVRFLLRKLGSLRTYDLSAIGRERLNSRFGSKVPTWVRSLTPSDLLGATLQSLETQTGIRRVDDVDSLATRRLRAVGELLSAEVGRAWLRVEATIRQRLESNTEYQNLSQRVPTEPLDQALRSLFGKNPLSQFADHLNPLADVTHKRRLTGLGPGGLGLDNAKIEVRSIHPSHYGRLCPVETPEGQNAGRVNSPTVEARWGRDGRLYATLQPFSEGWARKTCLSGPQQQGLARVATGILATQENRVPQNPTLTRVEGREFTVRSANEIDRAATAPTQTRALGPNLIPFREHDDGNRVLRGSNRLRQSLPLLQPEAPRVTTGLDSYPVRDTGHLLRARWSGYVSLVTAHRIVVHSWIEGGAVVRHHVLTNKHSIKIASPELSKSKGSLNEINQAKHPSQFATIEYRLAGTHRTNQSTWRRQRPVVQEGQWVEAGELLADGVASQAGELAVGRNLLVAYTPWDGLNFEDARVVSERLVQEDLATTFHVDDYEAEIRLTRLGYERFEPYSREIVAAVKGYKTGTEISLEEFQQAYDSQSTGTSDSEVSRDAFHADELFPGWQALDENGIIRAGQSVVPGQILALRVRPVTPRRLTPYERLRFDVLEREPPTLLNTSLRVPKDVYGRVLAVQIYPPTAGRELEAGAKFGETPRIGRVRISIAVPRKLQIGDKLAGRHGNKGIIARIASVADRPYLADGTPVDLVLNPLGVPSRRNVGQVYESLLSLAGKVLGERYRISTFDERTSVPRASRSLALTKLTQARAESGRDWLFDPTCPGKRPVFDGRTGLPFEQEVAVGEAYILKLVHRVDDKRHSRSTGPYSLVTQQPVRGRARNGGQRVGERERWALEGFGASYTLQEILTIKADDVAGRGAILTDSLLENRPLAVDRPDTFRVLARELQALGLEVSAQGIASNLGTQPRDLRRAEGLHSLSRYVVPDVISQERLRLELTFGNKKNLKIVAWDCPAPQFYAAIPLFLPKRGV